MLRDSLADVLYACVLIVALWAWGASAPIAIVASTTAYLAIASVRALANSAPFHQYMQHRAEQITIRQLHVLQHESASLPVPPDPLQIAYVQAADPVPPRHFVPPVDRTARKDAVTWLMQLWETNERLDPTRVLPDGSAQPGKVQLKQPSNREAVEYMISRDLLRRDKYSLVYVGPPTLSDALSRLDADTPVRGGGPYPHPPTVTPSEV